MPRATQKQRPSDPIAAQIIRFVELWQEFRTQQLSGLEEGSDPDSALEPEEANRAALVLERQAA